MNKDNTNTIIKIYREGEFDRKAYFTAHAQLYLKSKLQSTAHVIDVLFTEYRIGKLDLTQY